MNQIAHYARHIQLRIAAWFVILSWIFLGILFIQIIAFNIGLITIMPTNAVIILLPAGLGFGLVYILHALILLCPNCGKLFLVEQRGQKHPGARKISIATYWATTVLDVIYKNRFTCMYCSAQCTIKSCRYD